MGGGPQSRESVRFSAQEIRGSRQISTPARVSIAPSPEGPTAVSRERWRESTSAASPRPATAVDRAGSGAESECRSPPPAPRRQAVPGRVIPERCVPTRAPHRPRRAPSVKYQRVVVGPISRNVAVDRHPVMTKPRGQSKRGTQRSSRCKEGESSKAAGSAMSIPQRVPAPPPGISRSAQNGTESSAGSSTGPSGIRVGATIPPTPVSVSVVQHAVRRRDEPA